MVIHSAANHPDTPGLGLINWAVLLSYLTLLIVIGITCSRREHSTEAFFLGNRRIPWWAAGLSLFGTLLSAITFLAIPARAYATDWTLLPVNLAVLAIAPLIATRYLPALRRHRLTTVYQYLAILLLPALALSAVTGIPVHLAIALMGLLATLYTVLGGIEAVIWTDVLQTFVLLGGALLALLTMMSRFESGPGDLFRVGLEAGKFHWLNLNSSLVTDSVLVVVLGGLFSNALVPYSSDQTVVQRYLATADDASARRTLWLGALLVPPATLLFLLLLLRGTSLFVFDHQFPAALKPLASSDQILPWFIASQMPAGAAGLVIAGVFAAAMSSLDSSMHSIATTIVTDWLAPPLNPATEIRQLHIARLVTAAAGAFGTATAMLLATLEIRFLWDFFLALLGLVGGTLAGVMATAVFLPSAQPRHLWPAITLTIALLTGLKWLSPLNPLLYGFIAVTSVLAVSTTLSRIRP